VQLVAVERRRVLRKQPLLDLAREREFAVHLPLLGVLLLEPRVLDLGRGDVRERSQEAQVRLLEGAMPDAAVDVDQADDLARVLERRREHGLDAGEPDGVGERHTRTRHRVHQEQAVALLDDRGNERLRQADVLGRDALGDPDDGRHELAGGAGLQQDQPAVGLERLEHLVHEEAEQLVDRDVAQELDRQLVDDAQRLDELAHLLGGQARVGLGRVGPQELRGRLQDGVVERILPAALDADASRGLRLDLERDAADRDPVAGFQDLNGRQALAVQERAVAGAQVLDREAAVARPDDARVLAGEHLVGDRQVVHRGPADGGHGPVQRDLARSHAGSGDVQVKHGVT
jgi:hypothetical protein